MDMFLFICDQLDEGYVTLDKEQTDDLDEAREKAKGMRAEEDEE